MMKVGDQAPAFKSTNEKGEAVSLKDFKGKRVVLYFYPKDMTPGCTTEACEFRDRHPQFQKLNAVVLGVSPDDSKSHAKFIAKHELPFSLIVDKDHSIAEAYGVWVEKSMYGKKYMGVERSTFIIDETGKIHAIFRKVKPETHPEEVLESLKS